MTRTAGLAHGTCSLLKDQVEHLAVGETQDSSQPIPP